MIETKFGNFEIIQNERDAFDLVKFENKYLPEYFDKYDYLVGDLSDDILRLKGFSNDSKSKNYFHFIPEYLVESCPYNCRYYILKRIKGQKNNDAELFKIYQEEILKSEKLEEKESVQEEVVVASSEEEKAKPQNKKKGHKFKKYRNKKKANKNEPRANNWRKNNWNIRYY